eukprot:SAG11_NODE_1250_length_5389_cov_12.806994_6_plen_242_part_00
MRCACGRVRAAFDGCARLRLSLTVVLLAVCWSRWQLDKAVVQLGTNVGELGTQLTALLTPGDTLPAAVAAAQQNSLAMWQRNVTSLKTHVISVNAEVAKMQQAAADRQAKFMQVSAPPTPRMPKRRSILDPARPPAAAQFETLRQDILANLRKPMKGVGAAGKMLKKEEAFQAADTQFKAAEAGLVSFVEAKEAPTGLLSAPDRLITDTARSVTAASPPPAAAADFVRGMRACARCYILRS